MIVHHLHFAIRHFFQNNIPALHYTILINLLIKQRQWYQHLYLEYGHGHRVLVGLQPARARYLKIIAILPGFISAGFISPTQP